MQSAWKRAATAFAVVLALSVVGAAGAQAAEFHTESGENTTITGGYPAGEKTPTEEESFVFTTNNGILPCLGASFHGVMPSETASSLTITPTFSKCFLPMSMGSCDFVLHASGSFNFEISGGASCAAKPIVLTYPGCEVRIGPQYLSGVSYTSEGSGASRDIRATFNAAQIHYSQIGGGLCKGGQGTFGNGKITGIATLRADNSEGKQKGLWFE